MKDYAKVVMCFDFGTKKIGICVGETVTGASQLLQIVYNDKNLLLNLKKIFDEWRPDLCIVGIPPKPKDNFNIAVKDFIQNIEKSFKVAVITSNETLSSQLVPKNISANLKDSFSAKIIFEGWFNSRDE